MKRAPYRLSLHRVRHLAVSLEFINTIFAVPGLFSQHLDTTADYLWPCITGAEEIRRLFDAEQKHVAELRSWLQQKESLERDNDDATKQIDELERELDARNKELDRTKVDKQAVEKQLVIAKGQEENLQERLSAAQQELGIRRVAEQTHKVVIIHLENVVIAAVLRNVKKRLADFCNFILCRRSETNG